MSNEPTKHDLLFLAMIKETLLEFNHAIDNGVAEKMLERVENLIMGMADQRAQTDAWALQIMLSRDCTPAEAFESAESFLEARLERYANAL